MNEGVRAMGILKSLFGKKKKAKSSKSKPSVVNFTVNVQIIDEGEAIPQNQWYQKSTWRNKQFIGYGNRGTWTSDWKWAELAPTVKVAGISRENRGIDLCNLAFCDDFKMYLEDDPENPVNKNARKVMASATVEGKHVSKHIGYLPDEVANEYAGTELDIRPNNLFLPPDASLSFSLELVLLERSARYLKKQAKK